MQTINPKKRGLFFPVNKDVSRLKFTIIGRHRLMQKIRIRKLQKRAGSESARIPLVFFLRRGTREKNLIRLKPRYHILPGEAFLFVFLRSYSPIFSVITNIAHNGQIDSCEIVDPEILLAQVTSAKKYQISNRAACIFLAYVDRRLRVRPLFRFEYKFRKAENTEGERTFSLRPFVSFL